MVAAALEFILKELELRHAGAWLGSKRAPSRGGGGVLAELRSLGLQPSARACERLAHTATLEELLATFALKSVRLDSQMGLWGWLRGTYNLRMRHDIPSAEEMLALQCRGERYVTLLVKPEERYAPIGRHAGAFEFLMHDLEHAHKFFGDPVCFRGQTSFFRFLNANLPRFDKLRRSDSLFAKDLEYLMSDMNSHPLHLFKYLKAITLTATLRRTHSATADLEDFWMEVLKTWPAEVLHSALRINHPGRERPADAMAVSAYLAAL